MAQILNAIEINGENLQENLNLNIIAFKWAACGACGEHGGVLFITRSGQVYHTNYAFREFGISMDDLISLFPPLGEIWAGRGHYLPEWKYQYLELGNSLVVHESLWDDFSRLAEEELKRRKEKGEYVILYNIWVEIILRLLKD